jgi:YihY family inner membrane protein
VGFRRGYDAFDRFQQRHGWLGFALAVRQKYSEDQGGYLAATVTYYAFFSIFPLLLVATTVLGFVLRGHPGLERSIIDSALGQFPVIGQQLKTHSLSGNGLALGLGLAASLWAGIGVFLAAENAMNYLWGVPFNRRPDFLRARGRALLLLVVLGGGALGTSVLGSLATVGASFGVAWKIGSLVLSTALDFGLFWLGFRLLTAHNVTWRQLRGGAATAALLYVGLQALGGYYVGHVVANASSTYGTFALVIGLLSWIYLAAQIILLAAEGNVVATRRLWPRSFSVVLEQPPTDADRRALAQRGKIEQRRQDQQVEVTGGDADRERRERDSEGGGTG